MKENKDCKVVQDLLPNYIENLTSEETNQFIEEHLKTCEDCQSKLDIMKADLKVDTVQQDKREVEYIKKFNVKFKKAEYRFCVLIYALIAILVATIVIYFGRKYIIFKTLTNNASKYINATNYYVKWNSLEGSTSKEEIWVKDGKGRELITYRGGSTQYVTKKEGLYWYSNDKLETFFEGEKSYSVDYIRSMVEEMQNEFNNPKAVFTHSIEKIQLSDKVCYKIKSKDIVGTYVYYEKETGLPVKVEQWQRGELAGETGIRCVVTNYEFKFNCVKNQDLEYDDGKERTYEEVTTEAKIGDVATITDDNLKIEVSNITYDKENNHFNTDIKFSTVDNKGLDEDFEYEYIICDANEKVVTSSVPIQCDEEKDKIMDRFNKKCNTGETARVEFIYRMIGVGDKIVNSSENGTIHHSYSVKDLSDEVNLENLMVWITNVKYKNKGEEEENTPDKDFIFTFN